MMCLFCYFGKAEKSDEYGKYESIDPYDGETLLGMRHGKGVYYYENGDIYDGQWQRGRKHGYGTYTFKDGNQKVGFFCDDKYIGDVKPLHSVFPDVLEGNSSLSQPLNPLQQTEERLRFCRQRLEEGNKRREKNKKRREDLKKKYNL